MKAFEVFKLKGKEGALVASLGFALMVNALAMQISGIVGISGFLSGDNVNQILIVMAVDYALIMLIGSLQSVIIDKFNRATLIQWITMIFAFSFIVLRFMFLVRAPNWLNYAAMYILSEQQFVLFPLVFWVLANDIFNIAQAKRLFPLISGWNFIGKLLGIGIAAVSPALFTRLEVKPEEILLLNVAVYMIAFMVLFTALRDVEIRKTVQKTESLKETLSEGWDFVRNVPAFKYLMYAILALTIADTIIEFRFLVVTDAVFVTQATYQTFFSIYRLALTLAALVVQAFVTGYLIKQMQIKSTFYFFPIAAGAGAAGMLLVPGVGVAVAAMATVKLVRDTIHESGRASFLGLVPEERRGRVSTMFETYFNSAGTILGALLALLIVTLGVRQGADYSAYYLGVAVVAGAFALWSAFNLARQYDNSMLNWRLKRRQRHTNASLLDKLTD
jgi:ATP/ADP translocase